MLDTGSTALEVARNLPRDERISVITLSLYVALELHNTPINVLLLGGYLRKDYPTVHGPLTEEVLEACIPTCSSSAATAPTAPAAFTPPTCTSSACCR